MLKVAFAEAGVVWSVATRALALTARVRLLLACGSVLTRLSRSCTVAVPLARSRLSRSTPTTVPSRRLNSRSSPLISMPLVSPKPPLISVSRVVLLTGFTFADEVIATPAVSDRLPVMVTFSSPLAATDSGRPSGISSPESKPAVSVWLNDSGSVHSTASAAGLQVRPIEAPMLLFKKKSSSSCSVSKVHSPSGDFRPPKRLSQSSSRPSPNRSATSSPISGSSKPVPISGIQRLRSSSSDPTSLIEKSPRSPKSKPVPLRVSDGNARLSWPASSRSGEPIEIFRLLPDSPNPPMSKSKGIVTSKSVETSSWLKMSPRAPTSRLPRARQPWASSCRSRFTPRSRATLMLAPAASPSRIAPKRASMPVTVPLAAAPTAIVSLLTQIISLAVSPAASVTPMAKLASSVVSRSTSTASMASPCSRSRPWAPSMPAWPRSSS